MSAVKVIRITAYLFARRIIFYSSIYIYIHRGVSRYVQYTEVHVYIHTCVWACIPSYINTSKHPDRQTDMHACMHACMHAYIHTYIHTYVHVRAYMHTYIHYIHAYLQTCILAHMHTCIHAHMHTCIHAYMHTSSLHMYVKSTYVPRCRPMSACPHDGRNMTIHLAPKPMLGPKFPQSPSVPRLATQFPTFLGMVLGAQRLRRPSAASTL